ncbi:MAG: hypothetical protein NZ518_00890, partial [Dehalococcoidia bacterium]|nr:hypothetical protein [Dehalococcoidia bacterium]
LIPLWMAPDEPVQAEYAMLIAQRSLAIPTDPADFDPGLQRRIVEDMLARDYFRFGVAIRPPLNPPPETLSFAYIFDGGALYIGRQPLYHLIGGALLLPLRDHAIETQALALRIYSAALFAVTVGCVFGAARAIFPARPLLAFGATAFIALLPQAAYIGGMINNDNLAALIAAAVFWLVAVGERRGYRWWVALGLMALAALAFLTKRSGLFLVAFAVAPPGWAVLRWAWARGWRWRLASVGSVTALTAIGLALLLLPTPVQRLVVVVAGRWIANASLEITVAGATAEPITWQLLIQRLRAFVETFFESYIATYGALNIALAPVWYGVWAGVALVALIGLWVFALRARRLEPATRRATWWLAAGLSLVLAQVALYLIGLSADGSPVQGRYLFVAHAPIAILLGAGLAEIVPWRARLALFPFGVLALILFAGMAILTTVAPAFYS